MDDTNTTMPPTMEAGHFAQYPPQARELAVEHLELLGKLPRIFGAVLLRELIGYDSKFPAERLEMNRQLTLLGGLSGAELAMRMQAFSTVRLSPELEKQDFVRGPGAFIESLTAWLWSSGQMEIFRSAAESYAAYLSTAAPTPRPKDRRLGIVVVGTEVVGKTNAGRPLFRKLHRYGVRLSNVIPENGQAVLLEAVSKRARNSADREYLHWCVDGAAAPPIAGTCQLSYTQLERPRDLLLQRIQREINSGAMGPERLRTAMAQLQPEEIGLGGVGSDPVLDHFSLSLLTEGSGTQIFSTTFVQWAARECVRRAQPETILLRYAARKEAQPMNVMLSTVGTPQLDPLGSLVDAEMGAYYTWLNMNRLSGADEMSFLAWAEGGREAILVGRGLPHGTTSDSHLDMHQVLAMLS